MYTVKVSQGGRFVIPAELREKLDINQGDELILEERDGDLVLASKRQRIRRAREEFRRMLPPMAPGRSLVDELLAERQAEVASETAETRQLLQAREKRHGKQPKSA